MPVIVHNSLNAAAAPIDESSSVDSVSVDRPSEGQKGALIEDLLGGDDSSSAAPQKSTANDLLDIFNSPAKDSAPATNGGNGIADLLNNDFFSGAARKKTSNASVAPASDPFSMFDGLGGSSNGSASVAPEPQGVMALNKNGIEVQLFVESDFKGDEGAKMRLVASNNNPVSIQNVLLRAAVTKAFKIELLPPSGQSLTPNGDNSITQLAKVTRISSGPQQLKMRLMVTYVMNGSEHTVHEDVSSFPGLSI
ncbi:hypothetical protein L596_007660 [Steinernema carpocapsae]|uniref:GAE domain-containing protein n=1 Tax=Steinernema carpocapsae TaxID=34508 RepID=A0A4V6A633_STECR|nr:hypothetical protein L596_007660 [Steinernema carpocapsae]